MTLLEMPALRRVMLALALFYRSVGAAHAQEPAVAHPTGGASVMGVVLDAVSGGALAGTELTLQAIADDLHPLSGSPAAPTDSRRALTDAEGRYRFGGLRVGTYRLHVRRLGYRPETMSVEVPQTARLHLMVGLIVHPVRLEPLLAQASPEAMSIVRPGDAERGERWRVQGEHERQARYLAGDARSLTSPDIAEAITAAEPDLFRALQQLPGIAARDELTARLLVRGGSWSETRVYFDGLPVFNPVHGAGLFSGIDLNGIGTAVMHPGVRSAALGEGAAGALELTSRRAGDTTWGGAALISPVSAQFTTDRQFGGGRGGFSLAARRSFVDALAVGARDPFGALLDYLPYTFLDVTGRLDLRVGARSMLHLSGTSSDDAVDGTPDILTRGSDRWGNRIGQVSLTTTSAEWSSRHFIGMSDLVATLTVAPPQGYLDAREPIDQAVRYVHAGGEWSHGASAHRWRGGYTIVNQSMSYAGSRPNPYFRNRPLGTDQRVESSTVGSPVGDSLRLEGHQAMAVLWQEAQWEPWSRLTMQMGVRLEMGSAVRDAGRARLGPRLTARYTTADGSTALTGGWGRSFQYLQAPAPVGPRLGADMHVADLWLLASETSPAIRADVLAAGVEHWLAEDWIGAVNVYSRRATGIVEPYPTPGELSISRPLFTTAANRAHGVELSLRRLAGRVTGSLNYSAGRSTMTAGRYTYAAIGERRHLVNATAMVRSTRSLRFGAAFTAASGAPFTRVVLTDPTCRASSTAATVPCPPYNELPVSVGAPNAQRAAASQSLDALADWTYAYGRWELGAYAQLRNVLDVRNAVTYTGTPERYVGDPTSGIDRFQSTQPRRPLVGVRVAF